MIKKQIMVKNTNDDNQNSEYDLNIFCLKLTNVTAPRTAGRLKRQNKRVLNPAEILVVLWLFAGLGQSLAEMSSETLIGENIAEDEQGKVYGSHFAFSHLWWAIAYPIAGFTGSHFARKDFLFGGIIALAFLGIALLVELGRLHQ